MPSSSFCCQCFSSPHLDSFGPSKVQARLRYPSPESGEMQNSKKENIKPVLEGPAWRTCSLHPSCRTESCQGQIRPAMNKLPQSTKKTKAGQPSPELGLRRGAPSCSTSAGPRVDLPPSAGSPRASHPDQKKHWKMALIGFLALNNACERYQHLGCRQGKSLALRRQLSPCAYVNLRARAR